MNHISPRTNLYTPQGVSPYYSKRQAERDAAITDYWKRAQHNENADRWEDQKRADYSGRRPSAPQYELGVPTPIKSPPPYRPNLPPVSQLPYRTVPQPMPSQPVQQNVQPEMQTFEQWQPNTTDPYRLSNGYHDSSGNLQDEIVYPNSARDNAKQAVYDRQQERAVNSATEQRGYAESAQRAASAPKDSIPTMIEMENSLGQIPASNQLEALDEFFNSFGKSTQLNSRQFSELKKAAYALARKNIEEYQRLLAIQGASNGQF